MEHSQLAVGAQKFYTERLESLSNEAIELECKLEEVRAADSSKSQGGKGGPRRGGPCGLTAGADSLAAIRGTPATRGGRGHCPRGAIPLEQTDPCRFSTILSI